MTNERKSPLHLYYSVSDDAWKHPEKRYCEIPKELKELTDKLMDKYSVQLIPSDSLVMFVGLGPPFKNYHLIKSFLERLVSQTW